jgi:aerobic-type carbon monoxide dehydrogenase small subunit (CoxS/CutS family)/carbon monoxide dehydrogenase subunit G
MTQVALTVNGRLVQALVEPRTHLADFLREQLHLTGTHLGCEQGVCGACTISIDGAPQRSCITYAVDCDGSEVRTIEGFDDDPLMVELREAFSEYHALQCGFCTPGMLITARDIVARLGEITAERIREELAGNLCRCTGYVGIVNAVRAVANGKLAGAAGPAAVVGTATPVAIPTTTVPDAPIAAAASAMLTQDGQSTLTEHIVVNAAPDAVWAALADPRRVAACVPGAKITEVDGEQLVGTVRVAMGPIKAEFSGRGTLTRNDATREGSIIGQSRDAGSGSLAHGEARFAVRPAPTDQSTILDITLSWRLSGMLAQFNRSGLVHGVVRQIAAAFARNLEASLTNSPAPAPHPLGLLALLWSMIKMRLIGR